MNISPHTHTHTLLDHQQSYFTGLRQHLRPVRLDITGFPPSEVFFSSASLPTPLRHKSFYDVAVQGLG